MRSWNFFSYWFVHIVCVSYRVSRTHSVSINDFVFHSIRKCVRPYYIYRDSLSLKLAFYCQVWVFSSAADIVRRAYLIPSHPSSIRPLTVVRPSTYFFKSYRRPHFFIWSSRCLASTGSCGIGILILLIWIFLLQCILPDNSENSWWLIA